MKSRAWFQIPFVPRTHSPERKASPGLPMSIARRLRHTVALGGVILLTAESGACAGLPVDTASTAVPGWRQAQPAEAMHAMVASEQHEASRVGLAVLRAGGNAVDAAVAMGYALAVVNPCCGNIGGGGFMTLHLADGRNLFLDFRETAPRQATETMFQDAEGRVVPGRSTKTFLSVGVPGTVMGLNDALRRYGTMPLAKVMAPAIKLARDGFKLGPGDIAIMDESLSTLRDNPIAAATFLDHGRVPKAGHLLRQPALARTLQRIADHGTDGFYRGPTADALVAASQRQRGLLTHADLADYRAVWRKPLECAYHDVRIVTAPPPGSGTVVCEVLQVLENEPLKQWGWGSSRFSHTLAEAERHAFADRNTVLGDPAFVKNPVDRLLSTHHIDAIRAAIQPDTATPSAKVPGLGGNDEGMHTTHFSVLDRRGNAVAITYTINALFGSGLMADDTGFLLNNEMDDFTSKPGVPNLFGLVQGHANAIQPGKRPLSSMSPTIVLKDGKPLMLTGSPGGSTIISTVVETIVNVLDFGMNAQQAVDAPRMHMQWYPDRVDVEPGYLEPDTRSALEHMGYKLHEASPWGAAEVIVVDPASGRIEGANDGRREAGLAIGE